jgi:hypothetical protein
VSVNWLLRHKLTTRTLQEKPPVVNVLIPRILRDDALEDYAGWDSDPAPLGVKMPGGFPHTVLAPSIPIPIAAGVISGRQRT